MQYQTKKKLTRYIGIFLALLIVSYTAFEMKDVARGPELVIDYPTSGATVTTGLISVKGSVERISAIQINGNELFTDLSGHFTKDILLSEGYNVIEVRAEDRGGYEKIYS